MSRKRILLWGGTGFIGRALASAISNTGAELTILKRSSSLMSLFDQKLRFIEYESNSPQRSKDVLRDAVKNSDVIYNLAGTSGAVASNLDPLVHLEANCQSQLQFLEACREAGNCPHVVFASSRLVYGKPVVLPVDETHPLAPGSVYAVHKLAVEGYHQIWSAQGAITSTICRISVCYGQDGWTGKRDHGFLNTLILGAKQGKPLTIFGGGDQIRDYIHVRDLCRALLLCGESSRVVNEIVNVGSGEGITIAQVAQMISAASGAPVVNVPWPAEHLNVETGDYVGDIAKLSALTGFKPALSMERGIAEELAAITV